MGAHGKSSQSPINNFSFLQFDALLGFSLTQAVTALRRYRSTLDREIGLGAAAWRYQKRLIQELWLVSRVLHRKKRFNPRQLFCE